MFLSEKTPLLAVDIGTHSVKLAQISGSKNKFELMNFSIMPLSEGCVVDGVVQETDEVVDTLEKMIKVENIDTKYAVASIAGGSGDHQKNSRPQEVGGRPRPEHSK